MKRTNSKNNQKRKRKTILERLKMNTQALNY